MWEEGFWVLSEKLGVCFQNSVNYSVVSGLSAVRYWPAESEIWSSGSKTSITSSWHGNLNFRRFIYFMSGFCFWSEFYFRNDIHSSTFPCAWPGDHGGGRFYATELPRQNASLRVSDRFSGPLGRNLTRSADQCDLRYV